MKTLSQVLKFHDAFGVPVHSKPHLTDEKTNRLRVDLLKEETSELQCAIEARDPVAVLDALTDLQYVLDGAYLSLGFGLAKEEAFAEVHASNMSKLGVDGKPVRRSDGKILKGPNFRKPELQAIIQSIQA